MPEPFAVPMVSIFLKHFVSISALENFKREVASVLITFDLELALIHSRRRLHGFALL